MTVRLMLKVCSVAALVLLVFFALGPAKWTPRSGLGFEFDHFVGYFVFTLCSVSLGRGHSRSGEPLRSWRWCWRACNLFYRVAHPIMWRPCIVQPGCWRRRCLLSFLFEHRDGFNQSRSENI